MAIQIPTKLTFYTASEAEKGRLLAWIPSSDLNGVTANDTVADALRHEYPTGLEIEVTERAFLDFGLLLEPHPMELVEAYHQLEAGRQLSRDGMVDGQYLRELARTRRSRVRQLDGYSEQQESDAPPPSIAFSEGTGPNEVLNAMRQRQERTGGHSEER